MTWDSPEAFALLATQNKAAGRCPLCGGSGVVAAMTVINRTGDPHANQKCSRCKGTGKYPMPKKLAPEPRR